MIPEGINVYIHHLLSWTVFCSMTLSVIRKQSCRDGGRFGEVVVPLERLGCHGLLVTVEMWWPYFSERVYSAVIRAVNITQHCHSSHSDVISHLGRHPHYHLFEPVFVMC